MRRIAALAVCGLLLAACGESSRTTSARPPVAPAPSPTASTAPPTTSTPTAPLASISLRLERVAQLAEVSAFATRANDTAMYMAEKRGTVQRLANGALDPTPVLDISAQVQDSGERGLLGIAFSPDGQRLYAHFSNRNGDTRVTEFVMKGNTADPATAREILAVDQPYANHNGGQLAFGPDGMLYLGLGDGGSQGDPENRAQNRNSLLGKILRIDPRPSGNAPYQVPADNPFVNDPKARPEVYAYGLRNPWRFSFDTDGSLWIGDVGQNAWEEIDRLPAGAIAGANLGWPLVEGNARFKGAAPAGAVPPISVYSHDDGACAVIGGGVYRGAALPALTGTYLFIDYCDGALRGLRLDASGAVAESRTWPMAATRAPTTLGRDASGEWFVGTGDGSVLRVVAG